MGPLVKASFGCGLARTNDTAKCSSRLVTHSSIRSPKLASGGAPGVGSVIWNFMVRLLQIYAVVVLDKVVLAIVGL